MTKIPCWLFHKSTFFDKLIDNNYSPVCPIRDHDSTSFTIERHGERELLLVIAGDTLFELNGKVYPATPGTAFFIDHWVSHCLGYNQPTFSFMHLWIHLQKETLLARVFKKEPEDLHFFCTEVILLPSELLPILNLRWDLLHDPKLDKVPKMKIRRNIVQMLLDAIELNYITKTSQAILCADAVEKIRQYITVNYGKDCSMAKLEKLTGYSRFHLMRSFKAETGETIGEYINQVRRGFVDDATGKGLTQKEIADLLGFSSPAAFWLWKHRDQSHPPEPLE